MSMMQTGSITISTQEPSTIQAGDTSSFQTVYFPTPFPEGSNVIVIPMVQTFNGPDTPGVRIAEVTTTGFKIRMNELVAEGKRVENGGPHTSEKIGWVAYSD